MTTKDALKSLGRAVLGFIIVAALVFCAIGTVSILLCDGYYQFAVATAIVIGFAVKPMWEKIKSLLL